MRCPTLTELPLPLTRNATGWPWLAVGKTPNPAVTSLSIDWPVISVITPSLNQVQYLEQTLRSVLLQAYPALEYIVMDGGSTDGSVELLARYAPWLQHWESQPDRGQSHAINKGFAQATGEILCWLNSDDYYLPGTFYRVARALHQTTGKKAIVGHIHKHYADGRPTELLRGRYESPARLRDFLHGYAMHQSSIFWRRELTLDVGNLREDLSLIMDYDYWVRFSERCTFFNIDAVLSAVNYHAAAKTGDGYERYYAQLCEYWRGLR